MPKLIKAAYAFSCEFTKPFKDILPRLQIIHYFLTIGKLIYEAANSKNGIANSGEAPKSEKEKVVAVKNDRNNKKAVKNIYNNCNRFYICNRNFSSFDYDDYKSNKKNVKLRRHRQKVKARRCRA